MTTEQTTRTPTAESSPPEGAKVQTRVLSHTAGLPPRQAELVRMLTYRRPAGSKSEEDFIERFITPLGASRDRYGNLWRQVGDEAPTVLWCAHTDTVHDKPGRQAVAVKDAAYAYTTESNCLGADDTTGVWMLVNMIRAGVPGLYCFHAAEEKGGIGSNAVAAHTPGRLTGIRYAIAFDRAGYGDIITHQYTGRTASDAFAASVAELLLPLRYEASDGGTFTDSASYEAIVPECSNLSVGYFYQHSKDELQDLVFAEELLEAVLSADWGGLVCQRDPSVREDDWGMEELDVGDGLDSYVRRHPHTVALYLRRFGVTEGDIEAEIWASEEVQGEGEAAQARPSSKPPQK
jgi:Peptidase family M28